ncbi:uncharacterized protein LOC132548422 [Ylistrum balloti]|uniref:uncharacterized protein LOC132548422 n=1 Tax=Ylistrum balloti TaxID=509963 RepID=UPI002905B602|nr:uncharacterized protein LOC132548422 [Ylistrum balloti]
MYFLEIISVSQTDGYFTHKKQTLFLSLVILAIVVMVSFMMGYKMSTSKFLPSVASQYQDNIETSTTSLPDPPISTIIPPVKGYIVYDCDDQHPGPCGGWSDRMAGIYSSYVISVLLRRHFLIRCTRSFNLSDYLVPNLFDWKYNSSILTGRSWDYQDFFSKTPNALKKDDLSNLRRLFPHDVDFVRMNLDYTERFRYFHVLPNLIPWVLELHFADIFLNFFNTFFQPTQSISQTVSKFVQNEKLLACAHITVDVKKKIIGNERYDNKEQLDLIWNLLKVMMASNYSIFVSTNSKAVRNTANTLFTNLLEVEGPILDIDKPVGGSGLVDGSRKVVTEFLILAKCDVLVLTKSGFGIMAAYLNNKTSDIYCLTTNDLVPCSRYTIYSFYPDEIFSPV